MQMNKIKSAFTYAEALITLLVCGMISYMSMDFIMTIVQDKKDLMVVKNFNVSKDDSSGRSKELQTFTTEQYSSQFRVKNITGAMDFDVAKGSKQSIILNKKDYYKCTSNGTQYNILDNGDGTKTLVNANDESDILEAGITEDAYPRFEGLKTTIDEQKNNFTPNYYCKTETEPKELYKFEISDDTKNDRKFKLVFYDAKVSSN